MRRGSSRSWRSWRPSLAIRRRAGGGGAGRGRWSSAAWDGSCRAPGARPALRLAARDRPGHRVRPTRSAAWRRPGRPPARRRAGRRRVPDGRPEPAPRGGSSSTGWPTRSPSSSRRAEVEPLLTRLAEASLTRALAGRGIDAALRADRAAIARDVETTWPGPSRDTGLGAVDPGGEPDRRPHLPLVEKPIPD